MKKIITIFITFFCLALILPANTKAAKRNANDITKLKKIVNEQLKKGANISKDIENDYNYTWDKNGRLESISWDYCNLIGDIKIPSFNKLKSLKISRNKELKSITVEDNKSLEEIAFSGYEDYENEQSVYFPYDKIEIKGCINLKSITIYNANKIKTGSSGLDLSRYTNLKELNLHFCSLKNLDISNNKKLTRLDISNNNFEKIDLSNNKNIQTLVLDFNNFSAIDIKNNTKTEYLDISFNPCTEFYFTTLKNLKILTCESTKLTKLDLSDSKKLVSLRTADGVLSDGGLLLGEKPELTFMDCHNNKKLTSIDLNGCTALTRFNCSDCGLTELNLDKTTSLIKLYCKNNNLKELNTSSLTNLDILSCSNNQLVSLDLSNNKKLRKLLCKGNNITGLDLSNCPKLLETDKESFTYDAETTIIQ